ncbi:hypothetical protein CKO44_21810 [Rubrivivax gelatinosus]|uniref:glycosyltransferase n=1 Tax=Rubrivivax gelatinosus TaxID=28068 RepID=UPI001906BC94|nr:glycosyltransferase [Rubrivivax gelatinosus]MBK1616095.1 hypothetical protein [Rubrivivax gelatinosus]
MNPAFSVATAVRNGMPLIRACVASVAAQPELREHLVQDACSSDGTAAWCAGQPGLALRSERDSGMYDAINRAWSRSGGAYLSWLNADEQYLPGALAAVQAAFERDPGIDAVFGDAIIVGPDGRPLAYRREPPPRAFYIRNSFLYLYSCTLFYRRRLWDEGLLRLDTRLRYAADMDLVLRLLDAGCRFARVDLPLASYMATGANLSMHSGMAEETRLLQRRHGALRWGPARALARVPRWIERWSIGGFASRSGVLRQFDPDAVAREWRFERLGTRYSVFDPSLGT